MAETVSRVKLSKPKAEIGKKQTHAAKAKAKVVSTLSLADERSDSDENLLNYNVLLFGAPKIGKTALTAEFEHTHHLMLEDGARNRKIYQRLCPNWDTFAGYIDLLCTEDHEFRSYTVDVVEIAYDRCVDGYLEQEGLDEVPEDFGKTWGRIRKLFLQTVFRPKLEAGMGALFLSHAINAQWKNALGEVQTDLHPGLSGKMLTDFTGAMDVMIYLHFRRGIRTMQLLGDGNVHCGHRFDNHFRTTKGDPIQFLPMGNSPREAYENLMAAFANEIDPKELDCYARKPFVGKKGKGADSDE